MKRIALLIAALVVSGSDQLVALDASSGDQCKKKVELETERPCSQNKSVGDVCQGKDGKIYKYFGLLSNEQGKLEAYFLVNNGSWWRMNADQSLKFESVFFDNGPDYYEHGLARFIRNGKVGFHDDQGNVVIEPLYDFALPLRNGKDKNISIVCKGCWVEYPAMPKYAPMSSSNIFGKAINIDEKMLYHLKYKGGKWGAINKAGKIVIPLEQKSLEAVEAKLAE